MRCCFMSLKEIDAQLLQYMVNYCNEIEITINNFGKKESFFKNNFMYRNALSMPIFQIGELANHLSEEFLKENTQLPWTQIIGMRTRFAYGHQVMDNEAIWDTAIHDIPQLNQSCKQILRDNKYKIPTKKVFKSPNKER